jgi:RIO kinase 2
MVVAADRVRSLNKYEKTILLALERGMKRYSWVPLEMLKTATKLSESEINYRLSRLIRWGMVRFNPVPYDGYSLVFGGYDTLALATLTRKGTISALGTQIGEGKESVVYDALGLGPVAIKFHRIGGRSFPPPGSTVSTCPRTGTARGLSHRRSPRNGSTLRLQPCTRQ